MFCCVVVSDLFRQDLCVAVDGLFRKVLCVAVDGFFSEMFCALLQKVCLERYCAMLWTIFLSETDFKHDKCCLFYIIIHKELEDILKFICLDNNRLILSEYYYYLNFIILQTDILSASSTFLRINSFYKFIFY